MAVGGFRPGSGRKKGSTNKPVLRNFYSEKELEEFVESLKARALIDSTIAKFVAEHIFGKAVQPVEGGDIEKPIIFKWITEK